MIELIPLALFFSVLVGFFGLMALPRLYYWRPVYYEHRVARSLFIFGVVIGLGVNAYLAFALVRFLLIE